MVAIDVNGHPLNAPAIIRRGHVLVPLRATFQALGASVWFDARGRVIVAHGGSHVVQLPLGAWSAFVDGHTVPLEVPAQVIGGQTYVPLRFVAESLGAAVAYDASSNAVDVRTLQSRTAMAVTPADGSVVSTAYPTISASLNGASAEPGSIRLMIDGQDITTLATFDGTTITYMPRAGLRRGAHTVEFSGRTIGGEPFSQRWSFDTSLEAPPDAPSFGSPYSAFDLRFYVQGQTAFHRGDLMRFVLIAPPGGSASLQLCGLGYQYPLWNGGMGEVYLADVPAPMGFDIPACQVTAMYRSWSGVETFVPSPVYVGLFTKPVATPQPPANTPRPVPSGPRIPEPTQAPTAAPTAAPTPKPGPRTPAPHPQTPKPEPPPPPPTAKPTPAPHPTVRPIHVPRPAPLPRPRRTPSS